MPIVMQFHTTDMPIENSSRVNDYLTPVGTSPPYDADLEDILQWWAQKITGLAEDLVRPRWQPIPPRQPEADITWCALGIVQVSTSGTPQIIHEGTDITDPENGADILIKHERIEVMASFYGPLSQQYCDMLKDGCQMPQNNDQLKPYNMALLFADEIRSIPTFRNTQWLKRYDVRLYLSRKTSRIYQVRNLASASFEIKKD